MCFMPLLTAIGRDKYSIFRVEYSMLFGAVLFSSEFHSSGKGSVIEAVTEYCFGGSCVIEHICCNFFSKNVVRRSDFRELIIRGNSDV